MSGVAADDLDEYDVADLLDDLVAKSLVATTSLGATTRYRLLETVAAYALSRLRADDDLEALTRQHAQARADLTIERVARLVDGSGSPDLLQILLADLDDIDAVFSWACRHEPPLAERLFASTVPFLLPTRALGAPRMLEWANAVAELYQRGTCSSLSAGIAAGVMAATGGTERAERLAQSLLAERELSPIAQIYALNVAALCAYMLRTDDDQALDLIEQSLPLLKLVEDNSPHLWFIIVSLAQAGAFGRAVELLDHYDDSARKSGYLAITWNFAAGAALRTSDLPRSTASFATSLELSERYGDPGASWFRYQLALNELAARNTNEAAERLASVLPGLLDLGDPYVSTLAVEDYATALARTGRAQAAATMFAVAESQRSRVGFEAYEAYVRRRDRIISRLRDQLDTAVFTAAWEEGRTLTIDQAVRYAPSLLGT